MSDTWPERDWEAEFQAIAERLGVEIDDAPKATGVNRHVVSTGPDAEASDDLPWGRPHDILSTEPPTSSFPSSHPVDGASTDERSPLSPVPVFRPEWHLPDPQAQADRAEPAHHGAIFSDDVEPSDDESAEGFVEPDPTPLDVSDPSVVIMVAALVLGPLWLVYLVFFHRDAPTLWWSGGTGVALAGFVLAVVRQPNSRDKDDPDDGARV